MNNLDDILGFLDPHRDMRLDIDNMSYEVIESNSLCMLYFFGLVLSFKLSLFIGIAYIGRKDRQCQHWFVQEETFRLFESAEIPLLLPVPR